MSRVRSFVLVMMACAPLAAAETDQFPGQKQDGFLLPNGWMITPAGEQVPLKDLPLNILPLSDGRHALVATSGYNAHELVLVDLISKDIKQTETVRQSWFGLALSPREDKLWWSGGGGAALHVFSLKEGKLARADNGDPTADTGRTEAGANTFRSGLALDSKRNVLYSLDIDAGQLIALDLSGGTAGAESGNWRPAIRRGDRPQWFTALCVRLGRAGRAGDRSR